MDKSYQKRLDYELDLIEKKGFVDYFLMVADIVQWAKQRMLVGPARGSAAGSLVCYLLGITTIDPIEHDLLFERFIDVNRHDLPDIDIDFPSSHREEVIQYIREKYGEDHTAQLITFSTFGERGVIQDAARVLEIPSWKVKGKCLKDFPEMDGMEKLEGQIRQTSIHAAAIILSGKPIKEIASVNRDGALGMDKDLIEEYGLLKIDILGIETLSIIQDICEEVSFNYQQLYTLPLNDEKIYQDIFAPAKTLGVFQFEGSTVRKVCRDIAPTSFNQLVDITALARPGTMNSGTTEDYVLRSKGADYRIHPLLEPYTKNTLGCIIFQEQVMKIVNGVGGFSWKETSQVRRAIGKKTGLEKYESKFVKGAVKNGFDQYDAIQLWKQIVTHGEYSFNLSHAVAYAALSYWTAYLKTYYPGQFYARILKGEIEEEKIKEVLREWSGEFCPLDLNKSKMNFSFDGKKLFGGLTNIKGIGESAAEKIIKGQPYDGIEDFKSRVAKGIATKIEEVAVNGISWADIRSTMDKVQAALGDVELERPLSEIEEVIDAERGLFNIACHIDEVDLRSHNTEAKIKERGYEMRGLTDYIIIKAEGTVIFVDKKMTGKYRDEILDLEGKDCLFKISKTPNWDGLTLKKFKVL
jgi:DNA polymerase III alpha subunit